MWLAHLNGELIMINATNCIKTRDARPAFNSFREVPMGVSKGSDAHVGIDALDHFSAVLNA